MKTFVIDDKSNITARDGAESSHPGAEGYTAFSTQEELAALEDPFQLVTVSPGQPPDQTLKIEPAAILPFRQSL